MSNTKHLKAQYLADQYKKVEAEKLIFDGKHITLQSTGPSFDYVAYKNKMLLAYPESLIDVQLVYKGDTFITSKVSGSVEYTHKIAEPFGQTDDKIIGGYVVIKNKRGDFLTLLNQADFQKHRKVARTDYIWAAWYPEMCLETLMKKGVKAHFDDMYSGIEDMDNEQNDLEKNVTLTPMEELQDKLRSAFDIYQGDDKKSLRQLCADKIKSIFDSYDKITKKFIPFIEKKISKLI